MRARAGQYLASLRAALDALSMDAVEDVAERLFRAYTNGKQVFVIGNGGSASTASHMAADLAKNTIGPNMDRFRIMSLNDNTPMLTALANDLGYEHVFVEQLMNLIRAGDVLLAISGSGNSDNVLRAIHYARSRSAEVICLLGFDGGAARAIADRSIVVESDNYGVVEDVHLIINHILVEYFRARFDEKRAWSV